MNLKVFVFVFFIKILNIIPNTLYIDEGILLEDNVINYNWLKSAIIRNTTLVISQVELIKNPTKGTFLETKIIKDPKFPSDSSKNITITKKFITTEIYKSYKDLVKIEIDDTSKIDEIINNVKTELNNKTYTNIEKISTIIAKYESEETKEVSYKYNVFKGDKEGLFGPYILHQKYNENNVNNPSVISITYNKNFLIKKIFFSYFQVEDNFGIFEDSKINMFILENLKKTNLKSNNLFKNCRNLKTINLGLGYTDDINILENQNMLLNCENLTDFYLNNCDNQKISFENLKKLLCLNIGKYRKINEKSISYNNTSILDEKKFYNCEDLNFNNIDIDLVINKDTTGLDNVFYNCGKNYNTENKVKITINEDTVLDEINLDKMFNNSYFTDIEIINKSNKKITGSVNLFENKNLKYINIVDSSIDNLGIIFDKEFLEYKTFDGKLYKDIEGLNFEDFLKDQKTFYSKLRKQICDDEEKKDKEEEKNKKHSIKDINNISNNNTCCTKCLSCCYNCKCC